MRHRSKVRIITGRTRFVWRPFAPVVVIAMLAIVTMAACGSPSPPNSQRQTAMPTPVPVVHVQLSRVVATNDTIPAGMTVYRRLLGIEALRASQSAPVDSPGFVDAALTEFDGDDDHDGDHEEHYRTFAAVFETVGDAERAFAAAVAHHESENGWHFTRDQATLDNYDYDPYPGLGSESVHYIDGSDYGFPELGVYLWRLDNVILQAVDFHPYSRPGFLRSVAMGMQARLGGDTIP